MRIDTYTQMYGIQSINTKKLNKTNTVENTSFRDKLELSTNGNLLQVAKAAVDNTSDIRLDIVNDIKAKISTGNYTVDETEFADKLIRKIS